MIIAHITTVHGRRDVRIFQKECITLAKEYASVHLIVGDGLGDELVNGVHVSDIGARPKSRIVRMLKQSLLAYRRAKSLKIDVAHFHDPELLPIGLMLALRKVRVVYDIHEDTRTQILLKHYIPKVMRGAISSLFGWWEDFVARRLFALVVPQEKMLERYARVNRCINLPNYVDLELYPQSSRNFDRPLLFHAGGLTIERGLLNMRAAADQLGSAGDVYIAGKLPSSIKSDELGSLKYLGSLGYEEVLRWYERANIGLILYNNVGQYHMASAVKSFEYMAASMPILLPNFGEWTDFNARIHCGLNVDVTNPVEIVKAICYLRDHPDEAARLGRNGRDYVEEVASWQSVSGRLVDLYREIT